MPDLQTENHTATLELNSLGGMAVRLQRSVGQISTALKSFNAEPHCRIDGTSYYTDEQAATVARVLATRPAARIPRRAI